MTADVEILLALTKTGQVVDALPFTAWSWSNSVSWSDPGDASVTVPLTGHDAAGRVTVETLRSIRRAPWGLSVVIVRDGRAEFAGPAVTLGWGPDEVTVGCSSIPALYDRRVLVAKGWRAQPWRYEANLHFELHTRDLVLELLQQGITSDLGDGRSLPLLLPAQSGASGAAVDYQGVDLKTVNEAVKACVDRDDGPDVLIIPDLPGQGTLQWIVNVGSPRLGATDSQATFDAPGSTVTLSGEIDVSEAVTTGYVLGDSSGSSRLIGVGSINPEDPAIVLERADRTSVSETRQEQLDALARSYEAQFSLGAETWQVVGDPQQWPSYGAEWSLGDVVTVAVDGHPWLQDGDYLRRVVGVKVDPDSITLDTTDVADGQLVDATQQARVAQFLAASGSLASPVP